MKRKLLLYFLYAKRYCRLCAVRTVLCLNNKRASFPISWEKLALRITSGSFAYHHFKFYYINSSFPLALRAEEREAYKYSILIYFCSCFAITNWAANPFGYTFKILHKLYPSKLVRLCVKRLALVLLIGLFIFSCPIK